MAVRPMKVWNAATSTWDDVAVSQRGDVVNKTDFAAKGDIIAGTGASAYDNLPAGSNGQMLMADSSATAGLRYVDPPTNRNLIINGAMQVHQRGTSVAGITSGSACRTADRWLFQLAGTSGQQGTWTQSIEADAPSGSGFRNSLKVLCTTANATLDAADFIGFDQRFEGQNLQTIRKGTSDAQQLTLSFWVKSNVTGTYIVELPDQDNTRAVSASYTVNASGTWEQKTITFPADTTGAFDNDNALSFLVRFMLVAGSNYTSGSLQTTWGATTTANRYVGQTDLSAATNNYWQITGVQLETGPVATPFEFEPYEATLRKCLRYYQRFNVTTNSIVGEGWAYNTTNASIHIPARPPMRAVPTVLDYSNLQLTDNVANNYNATSATIGGITGVDMLCPYVVVASGLTQYRSYALRGSNDGYIAFGAEL